MPCCKAVKYGWCKDIPVVDYKDYKGKEYCIFHAPQGKKGISVEEFNKQVFKRINDVIQDNRITTVGPDGSISRPKPCDLSGAVFEGNINFSQYNKYNAMPQINLSDATFSGDVDFTNVRFESELNFYNATFSKKSWFKKTIFEGRTDFSYTKFEQSVNFSQAEFKDMVDFLLAEFRGDIDFKETVFSGEAKFKHAKFIECHDDGNTYNFVNFGWSIFKQKADFINSEFEMEVSFHEATFDGKVVFLNTKFNRGATFASFNIDGKIRFEEVNLEKVSFIDTDLRKIDFINCTWPEKGGRNVLYDEIELFKNKNGKDFKDKIKKVEILYRQLKQKYKEEHNEPEVSNWHYGEKEMQRKRSGWKDFSFYLLNLYWASSGYGENPVRAVVVLLFLLLYASLALSIAGLTIPDNVKDYYGITSISWPYDVDFKKAWALFLNTLKYVTFQKDYFFKPVNWIGETVKILSQILIPLQTALFALAVRNRFRR